MFDWVLSTWDPVFIRVNCKVASYMPRSALRLASLLNLLNGASYLSNKIHPFQHSYTLVQWEWFDSFVPSRSWRLPQFAKPKVFWSQKFFSLSLCLVSWSDAGSCSRFLKAGWSSPKTNITCPKISQCKWSVHPLRSPGCLDGPSISFYLICLHTFLFPWRKQKILFEIIGFGWAPLIWQPSTCGGGLAWAVTVNRQWKPVLAPCQVVVGLKIKMSNVNCLTGSGNLFYCFRLFSSLLEAGRTAVESFNF